MVLDEERVYAKIAYTRKQILAIQNLVKEKSKEDIISDQWIIRGLKYSLQTAIEALIDIAYHLSAKHFKQAPADGRDAINILIDLDDGKSSCLLGIDYPVPEIK